MKIINAYWEERNTGLKTCEILFEKEDDFQNYIDSNPESNYNFSVVKIPVGNLELVHQFENIGYRYLENQILLTFNVSQVEEINPKWKRLLNGFTCRLINTQEELKSILIEVSHKMFDTDRFSLDPFWQKDISSKRYHNWILDLFESGTSQFYIISKNGTEIGFYSSRAESSEMNSCQIAGIYNKFKSSGYIFVLTWFWLIKSKEKEFKRLTTSISSNNRVMLSSLSKVFSFSVREVYIVLRKSSVNKSN
jgi:hypothetical protein